MKVRTTKKYRTAKRTLQDMMETLRPYLPPKPKPDTSRPQPWQIATDLPLPRPKGKHAHCESL
jgi:hypothetical protein